MNYFTCDEIAECIQEVPARRGDCSVEENSGWNKWLEEEFLRATAGWVDCRLFATAWEDAWRGWQRWRGIGMLVCSFLSLVYTHFGWFGVYIFRDIMYIFWWFVVVVGKLCTHFGWETMYIFWWLVLVHMICIVVGIVYDFVWFCWILYCLNVYWGYMMDIWWL